MNDWRLMALGILIDGLLISYWEAADLGLTMVSIGVFMLVLSTTP